MFLGLSFWGWMVIILIVWVCTFIFCFCLQLLECYMDGWKEEKADAEYQKRLKAFYESRK